MSSEVKSRFTVEQYLTLERKAEYKSEYLSGEIFAMGGASRRHNLISLNIGAEFRTQLKQRPCEVYTSDMRVKVSATGLYTYPDVVVVCGEPAFEDAEVDTLLNPTLLVEVLSKSTEDYDRGGKFEHYRTLESLQEYVLVAQQKHHVMHYVRQPDNAWLLSETTSMDCVMHLLSINCDLALTEVYAKVQLHG
jgi:Uma2 family endonuclease